MVFLGSSLVFSPAADGAASESDWEQWTRDDLHAQFAPLVQSRLPNTKPASCTPDSDFQSLCTGEILQNTLGMRIQPLNGSIGESEATQIGFHSPPHYL